MPTPEVWGPAVWTLFHTLIAKIQPELYPQIRNSLFSNIVQICRYLPCPECSNDASKFLAKIRITDYKTKEEFKQIFYLFHNWVNHKKRKPLFNYNNIEKYQYLYLPNVINHFMNVYNTKGNMKLLAETFQRKLILKNFIIWFKSNSIVFTYNKPPEKPLQSNTENNTELKVENNTESNETKENV
jgi:hypothetical protein